MNIDKIKKFLENKPRWVVIIVTLISILLIGAFAWFGISSCASVDVDKLNVNTDKLEVDVEGVKIHPKDVSLVNNRDDALILCEYIESNSIGLSSYEKANLLDSFGLNPNTYSILLNNYNLITFNNHCYFLEDL